MIIPYGTEVRREVFPWGNVALIVAMVAVFIGELNADVATVRGLIFDPRSGAGLVTSIFLHASLLHLLGNLTVLAVFGNAVSNRFKNGPYVLFFVLSGIAANLFYGSFRSNGALGASGAIYGVLAAFLILYPLKEVKVWMLYRGRVASFWIIVAWVAFDVYGSTRGGTGIAYHAHLGGFLFGVAWTVAAVYLGFVRLRPDEPTFMASFLGIRDPVAAPPGAAAPTRGSTSGFWSGPIDTRTLRRRATSTSDETAHGSRPIAPTSAAVGTPSSASTTRRGS